ncbi:adhesion G protein-coupled receptor B3 isoform X1 [Tachysurus ichikawai]
MKHWKYSHQNAKHNYETNGQWNPWGPWSGCSKSCDGGWQRHVWVCQGLAVTGQQCEGNGEEIHKCSEQRCPGNHLDNKPRDSVKES